MNYPINRKRKKKSTVFLVSKWKKKNFCWKELFRNENGRRRQPTDDGNGDNNNNDNGTPYYSIGLWYDSAHSKLILFIFARCARFASVNANLNLDRASIDARFSFFLFHQKRSGHKRQKNDLIRESVRDVTVRLKCFSAIRNFLDKYFSCLCFDGYFR